MVENPKLVWETRNFITLSLLLHYYHLPHRAVLTLNPMSSVQWNWVAPEGKGLGFNIIGGEGDTGIFISYISSDSISDQSEKMTAGDQILEVLHLCTNIYVRVYMCICILILHGPITVMNTSKNWVMPGSVSPMKLALYSVLPFPGNRIWTLPCLFSLLPFYSLISLSPSLSSLSSLSLPLLSPPSLPPSSPSSSFPPSLSPLSGEWSEHWGDDPWGVAACLRGGRYSGHPARRVPAETTKAQGS